MSDDAARGQFGILVGVGVCACISWDERRQVDSFNHISSREWLMPLCRRRIYAFEFKWACGDQLNCVCAPTGAYIDSIRRQTLSLSRASECIILESTGRRTLRCRPAGCSTARKTLNVLCIRRLMEFACPLLRAGPHSGAALYALVVGGETKSSHWTRESTDRQCVRWNQGASRRRTTIKLPGYQTWSRFMHQSHERRDFQKYTKAWDQGHHIFVLSMSFNEER